MECIVLAGGVPARDHPLYAFTQGRPKAMLEVGGVPMVDRVLGALGRADSIDRLIVVGLGPEDGFEAPPGVLALPSSGSIVDNLYAAIATLERPGPAAYCWSDIPLIEPGMIDRFVAGIARPECDVNAGLVARADLQARYPAVEDLWLRLGGRRYVAADFGVFRPAHALRVRPEIERLAPQRKSALRQARTVGLSLLVRYVLRRLTIPQLENHLARRYELRCAIRVVEDPELGLDVDGPADLELCRGACAAHG